MLVICFLYASWQQMEFIHTSKAEHKSSFQVRLTSRLELSSRAFTTLSPTLTSPKQQTASETGFAGTGCAYPEDNFSLNAAPFAIRNHNSCLGQKEFILHCAASRCEKQSAVSSQALVCLICSAQGKNGYSPQTHHYSSENMQRKETSAGTLSHEENLEKLPSDSMVLQHPRHILSDSKS